MSVFISYSHKDSAFVDRLATALVAKNIKVWKDKWKTLAGDSFVREIRAGIKGASHFCVVISRNSLQSRWVERELEQALTQEAAESEIVILPIRLDDSDVPSALSDRLYVDFRTDFDAGVKAIVAAVGPRYNRGDAGRISSLSRYFLDYAIEERTAEGKFFMQVDVVSFDLEESFTVLTQFVFRGNERATAEQFLLEPDKTLKEFVLESCAREFAANPARIKLQVRDAARAHFDIQGEEGVAHIDVDVRVKWLGTPARSSVLFDVGALIVHICETTGIDFE